MNKVTSDLEQSEAIERLAKMIEKDVKTFKGAERQEAIRESIETAFAALVGIAFPAARMATATMAGPDGVSVARDASGDVVKVEMEDGPGLTRAQHELEFEDFGSEYLKG